jgi:hypothetical protein
MPTDAGIAPCRKRVILPQRGLESFCITFS